jgi:MazG family protein
MKTDGKEYIEKEPHDFTELREIIRILRSENGCKWDRAQTLETLKKCLTDETEEVLQAIDKKDYENLQEELGDVLLQVLLQSEIAKENGWFTFDDVVQTLSEKMIRRHPHVFGDAVCNTPEESLVLWKEIKKKEKEDREAGRK